MSLLFSNRRPFFFLLCWLFASLGLRAEPNEWISLFDGRTLTGWKAAENPGSFQVVQGVIEGVGPRAHLFYLGSGPEAPRFENFELELEFQAAPGANSGVFFHTAWQDKSWPEQGLEVQINNSQPLQGKYLELKKTGSLYGVRNVYKTLVRDDVWATLRVQVEGPRVQIWVNGIQTVDYVQPRLSDSVKVPLRLGAGTFALQCHDPASRVRFREIRVRSLPPSPVSSEAGREEPDARALQVFALAKDNFPLVDLHTHLKGGLTLTEVLALGRRTGITAGVAVNGGLGFPLQSDADALSFLEEMKLQPAFAGLQAEGREWVKMFSPETKARFDYIFTDAMTYTNPEGRRLRLWIPAETVVGPDVQAFMDHLAAQAATIIASEPIDIYVNPTFLPEALMPRYDELWTEERMLKIIRAAAAHQVAIEINGRYRLPSARFVRLARDAGVRFTLGTNNTSAADYGDWSYALDLIRDLNLTWRDMWVPGHGPSRAQRELAATRP